MTKNLHQRLTILIPTKNRHMFLKRLLYYYRAINFKGCLGIGDSSEGSNLNKNIELIDNLENDLNIIHEISPGLSPSQADNELLKSVKTDYAAHLNDDDYLIPSGIDKCIEFLEKNKDYAASHGLALSVKTKNSEPHGEIIKCVKKDQPIREEEKPSKRFVYYLANYSDIHYSVFRIKDYSLLFNDLHANLDQNFVSISSAIATISGKVNELHCLYLVRHIQDTPMHFREANDAIFWLSNKNWMINLNIVRESAVKELLEQENIDVNLANRIFDQGLLAYLSIWLSQRTLTTNRNEIKEYLGDYLGSNLFSHWQSIKNDKFIKFARFYYPRIRLLFEKLWYRIIGGEALENDMLNRRTEILLPSLLSEKSKYHKDFMPIYHSITNPPRSKQS